MNDIMKFYMNDASDGNPTYSEIMQAGFAKLEFSHNWCQRAFPNYEPSEMVTDAPVLDHVTFVFLAEYCREKILLLTFRYLNHYLNLPDPQQMPHNNRRVTRLIKFLTMLGYSDAALTVFTACSIAMQERSNWSKLSFDIDETLNFWIAALTYKREQ